LAVVGAAADACGVEALTGAALDADGEEAGDCAAQETRSSERRRGTSAIAVGLPHELFARGGLVVLCSRQV
jgi:hypothetical protein